MLLLVPAPLETDEVETVAFVVEFDPVFPAVLPKLLVKL